MWKSLPPPGLGEKGEEGGGMVELIHDTGCEGNVHIIRANMAINTHKVEIPWTEIRFTSTDVSGTINGGCNYRVNNGNFIFHD